VEKFILKYFTLIRTLIAILVGVIISVVLIFIISKMPGYALKQFLLGPLLSVSRFANVIENASPIIFCGVAIAIAFQAKQFNIGARGEALFLRRRGGYGIRGFPRNMPRSASYISCSGQLAGLTGAIWGWVPGGIEGQSGAQANWYLPLMMTYIAYFAGLYLVNSYFQGQRCGDSLVSAQAS